LLTVNSDRKITQKFNRAEALIYLQGALDDESGKKPELLKCVICRCLLSAVDSWQPTPGRVGCRSLP